VGRTCGFTFARDDNRTRMSVGNRSADVACMASSLDDKELAVFLQMKAMFPMIDGMNVR
jgi:hypothetical protein